MDFYVNLLEELLPFIFLFFDGLVCEPGDDLGVLIGQRVRYLSSAAPRPTTLLLHRRVEIETRAAEDARTILVHVVKLDDFLVNFFDKVSLLVILTVIREVFFILGRFGEKIDCQCDKDHH